MYVPSSFVEADQDNLHDFIKQHSFGLLISHDGQNSVASHLPMLLDCGAQPHGRLIGHMARANPQWQHIDRQQVLAIFHGPHAYISPTWYEAKNVVPTWNYVAVHAYGKIRIEDNHARLLQIVRRYVDFYEAKMPQPWSIEHSDPEFIDSLVEGVVGFEIDVDYLEGKWKLSQNHGRARRERVIRALLDTHDHQSQAIASLMLNNSAT